MVQLFVSTPEGQPATVRDVSLAGDVTQLWRGGRHRRGHSATWAHKSREERMGTATPPLGASRFQYAGKELVQGRPLTEYGLQEGSTVHELGRLRGGAQLGKVVKGRSQVKKKEAGKPKEYADLQAKYAKMQEMDTARQQAVAAKLELCRRMELEEKNSKMNRLKIQNQWRKIMRLAKVENLRKDIEILSQNHERDVDRKDAIIQMLDRDLEDAEDQFQMALRAHLLNMDKLIDLQDARLLALEQEFEVELLTLEQEFATEREQITKQHTAETQELNDIISAVEAQEEEAEAEATQEHEQLREEIRNKNLEEINVLRITLDTQIEDLEQHFETAHINYLQNTDQRTTDFKYLTSKDQDLSREIEIKIRKIERLQGSLQHWRTKIAQNVKENAERNKLLTEERNAIQGHFQQLKGRMNKFRDAQAKRLGELTQNADQVKRKLKDQLDTGNRILTLAERARKIETEQEKVLPFYVSANSENVEREAEAAIKAEREADGGGEEGSLGSGEAGAAGEAGAENPLQASAWTKAGKPIGRWNGLDNFYKKYNKVLLDKLAIEREQQRLEAENANLQAIVKQYLDDVSVNEGVLSEPNPLLVINGRVNTVRALAEGRPDAPPAIEANHMVLTGRVNTRMPL